MPHRNLFMVSTLAVLIIPTARGTPLDVSQVEASHVSSAVEIDVHTLNYQLGLPKNSIGNMELPELLAANDSQKSSVYQSGNGLSFGDNDQRASKDYNYWFSTKTFSATLQGNDTMLGLKARGETVTAGMESSSIMPGMLLGVAMTLGKSRIDDEAVNQGKHDIFSFSSSLYSAWKIGNGFIEASVAAGRARNKTSRMATEGGSTGHLHSTFYAETAHAHLLAGYVYNLNSDWSMTPLAEVNYNRVSFGGHEEKWDSNCVGPCTSPATDDPKSLSTMEGGLGFNLAGRWGHDTIKLVPFANVMGYYNFRDRQTSERAVYMTGIDQMIVTSPERSHGRLRVNIGMSMIVNDRLNLDFGIIRNQMKGYKNNSTNFKLRYSY
ncbi:MAG: autotransporter outer membrane beta-barrel domain-containing protein [Endozoicomonadaceae bacterium]|nr:autotransporter outer membrane beta-barrel domain-containing protein [Endozoicomonadaceae bacterium]